MELEVALVNRIRTISLISNARNIDRVFAQERLVARTSFSSYDRLISLARLLEERAGSTKDDEKQETAAARKTL